MRNAHGQESYCHADVVIDTTGVYNNHRWLGPGGIPAIGEESLNPRLVYGLPDVLGRDRASYAGAHTLVVGSGYSAASTVVGLRRLARETEGTHVTWVTRQPAGTGPIPRISNDRLAARDEVAQSANRIATAEDGPVTYLPGTQVQQVGLSVFGGVDVELSGEPPRYLQVDRIVANVGYRPDTGLHGELQVQQCYASEAPMKIAAALLGQASNDCLDQTAADTAALVTSEPNFYILGNKSYGRDARFLIAAGLDQIRDLFAIVGDRDDLDLYRGAQNLTLGSTEC